LQAIAAPVILFGLISLFVYSRKKTEFLQAFSLSIGFLSGIYVEELIRRKYRLEKFFANLYGSPQMNFKSKQ